MHFRYMFLLIIFGLYGCNEIKEQHLESDRSGYYPLAVVSASSKPEITSAAYRDNIRRGQGTVQCVVYTTMSFGLLAPFCIPAIAADAMTENQHEKLQKEFDSKMMSFESSLKVIADQNLLRNSAIEYLQNQGSDAYEIAQMPTRTDSISAMQQLSRQGYPAALELSLLSLDFSEREVIIDRERKISYCLTVEVQARTIKTKNEEEIALEERRAGKCMSLEEWLEDGKLDSESTRLYRALSEYMIDDLLFIYHKDNSDQLTISPIKPELLIENEEIVVEDADSFEKKVVIEERWDNRGKPQLRKDFASFIDLQFTEVTTNPDFEWEAVSELGIKNVRYDFRIYKGKPRPTAITSSKGMLDFSGNKYPLMQYIFPGELFYSRDNLTSNTHQLELPLETCSWYFWTVRADFELNGESRVTEWSKVKANPYKSTLGTFYPIRTIASDDNPDCWEQKVDWGPL